MTEYQITIPAGVSYKISPRLCLLHQAAGGSTLVRGVGTWYHPETGERITEHVDQNTLIVDMNNTEFVDALNEVVDALHAEGEHTVLVRRLDGRGVVHFFLTPDQKVPYR